MAWFDQAFGQVGTPAPSDWGATMRGVDASGLAAQLRAQDPGINWIIKGRDTADELARFLAAKGVNTLSGLSLADVEGGKALNFGGVMLGNEGDIYSQAARSPFLNNQNEFAESNVGGGGVGFRYVQGPSGKIQLVPRWESSSDAGKLRDAVKLGALALGGFGLAGMGPLGSSLGQLGQWAAGGLGQLGQGVSGFMSGLMPGATNAIGLPLGTPFGLPGVGGFDLSQMVFGQGGALGPSLDFASMAGGGGGASGGPLDAMGEFLKRRMSTNAGRMSLLRTGAGLYALSRARKLDKELRSGDVTQQPGYQVGRANVERKLASMGYGSSSNLLKELQDYGASQYSTFADERRRQFQARSGSLGTTLNGLGLLSLGLGG